MSKLKDVEKEEIIIGAANIGTDGKASVNTCAMLSKINAKCLRLYNKGLTDEEIQKNYVKTTDYHRLMEKESE